ncbi:MAG: valine--tRNA ligase [Parcubacteria group bacterium]|jgi:valyl-tRNA synthetase
MLSQISKRYDHNEVEDKIYELWERSGFFNPDNLDVEKDAKSYTIILPPPNITDKLHLGHSAMLAIEDLLVRFHRMKGFRALWVPGTDHAAIATQNVVEKNLLKKGITRQSLGKEKFLEEVWKFLNETQATIQHQMRKMGASMDWSREAFTLDEPRKKAVRKMFVDMYNAGLIYRGYRVVNWCPRCHSTLADDEVEYKEETGKLYWLKYGPFILATSRPETKLGDTAVAVHPDDPRYKDMVGKKFMIPGVLGDFEIIVVADKAVDKDFGSGAIKVTPAHDFADYEIAQRHHIPMKQIIDEDGKMMDNCGKYAGMTTVEAREEIVKDMEKMGLIDHIEENYVHNLATCYRCGTVIEPIPSKQWFVAVDKKIEKLGNKSLKERALEAASKKEIKFIPERFTKRYSDWMTNLHDWCISRQIWFGHDIPVWYKGQEIYVGEVAPKGDEWTQDPDTLDTWFSSGMWTFSTLGWPEDYKDGKKTEDLAKFHPTQVLETGYDILTLWVSRMIIMTIFALDEVPFENVYLHGLVLDKHGKKMSKSKGNGIDPLEMIEKYGTDAVRLSLLLGSTPGNNVRISEEKIENFRNFVTKLWNIYRYFASNPRAKLKDNIEKDDLKSLSDRWIVSELNSLISEVSDDVEKYRFSLAGEKLEKFTWDKFAAWYVEIHKMEKNDIVLGYVFDKILKLWHPFTPFVTEKIFRDFYEDKLLMVEKYPESDKNLINKEAVNEFGALQEAISKIRNIRTSYHIDSKLIINAHSENIKNKEIIEKLVRIKLDNINHEMRTLNIGNINLDITNIIDVQKEIASLEKEIKNMENSIAKTEALLNNDNFIKKADMDIINQTKTRVDEYKEKLRVQRDLVDNLKQL